TVAVVSVPIPAWATVTLYWSTYRAVTVVFAFIVTEQGFAVPVHPPVQWSNRYRLLASTGTGVVAAIETTVPGSYVPSALDGVGVRFEVGTATGLVALVRVYFV